MRGSQRDAVGQILLTGATSPNDRIRIPDFQANDPNLNASVNARYAQAGGDDLLAEFARRARESGVFGP